MHASKAITTIFLLLFVVSLAGCGRKSKTSLGYQAPIAPVGIKITRQDDGIWTITGGLATEYGTFAIEQTFDMQDEFTYLVMRDRAKGTDQVFKLATRGYVQLHTMGEHKIRIERNENKVIVEVATISGSFDFDVYPDSQAVARVEFGNGEPDFVILNDKHLIVEYQSAQALFWSDDVLPLDSIQSVTLNRQFGSGVITFNWKDEVKDKNPPFVLALSELQNAEKNYSVLQKSLGEFAPHITFSQNYSNRGLYILYVFCALCVAFLVSAIPAYRRGKWHWAQSDRLQLERRKQLGFWKSIFSSRTQEEARHRRRGSLGMSLSFFLVMGAIFFFIAAGLMFLMEFKK